MSILKVFDFSSINTLSVLGFSSIRAKKSLFSKVFSFKESKMKKLYFAKGACSLSVRILIHELDLKCAYESVNLKNKTTANEQDYLTINPKGVVPAIELENGEILTENIAIHQYLLDKYNKSGSLMPPINDVKRYRVIEWMSYIASDLHKTCAPLFHDKFNNETKEIFKKILKDKLSFVDKHLKMNKFLLGDQFTSADCYLFVILTWLKYFKIEISDWQSLSRYFAELNCRQSIKISLEEEAKKM